jgi:hypothetical protein
MKLPSLKVTLFTLLAVSSFACSKQEDKKAQEPAPLTVPQAEPSQPLPANVPALDIKSPSVELTEWDYGNFTRANLYYRDQNITWKSFKGVKKIVIETNDEYNSLLETAVKADMSLEVEYLVLGSSMQEKYRMHSIDISLDSPIRHTTQGLEFDFQLKFNKELINLKAWGRRIDSAELVVYMKNSSNKKVGIVRVRVQLHRADDQYAEIENASIEEGELTH